MKSLSIPTALSACLLFTSSCAQELSPFTSDGCSAFPDGTIETKTLWLSCCTAHDLAYWQGGSYAERLQADQDLHNCVAQTGQPKIAELMLTGVRVGGTPFLPTTFRWGYGWSFPRGYKKLTDAEKQLIKASVETNPDTDGLESDGQNR